MQASINYHVWRIAREERLSKREQAFSELRRHAKDGADPVAGILLALFGSE